MDIERVSFAYKRVTNLTEDFTRLKSPEVDDEFWEISHCQVCLDKFSDPRTLACKHTFCRTCLQLAIDDKTQAKQSEDRGFECLLCGYFTKMPNYSITRKKWSNHVPTDYRFPQTIDEDYRTDTEKLAVVEKRTEVDKEAKWALDWTMSTFPKSYLISRGLNPFKRLKKCYVFQITPNSAGRETNMMDDEDDDDDDHDEKESLESYDDESLITAAAFYSDKIVVYDSGLQELQFYNEQMTLTSTVKQKYVYDIAILNSCLYMTVPTNACMKVFNLVDQKFAKDLVFTRRCYGMSILDNQIAVLMCVEGEEMCQLCYLKDIGIVGDIINLKGGRLKFQRPRQVAICPMTRLVYVTDREAGLIKCFMLDGSLYWERLVYDAGHVSVFAGNVLVARDFPSSIDMLGRKGGFLGRLESNEYDIFRPQCIATSNYKPEILVIDGNQMIHLFSIIPNTPSSTGTGVAGSKCCMIL
ncbi:hypothetical protein ACF0H5_021565 [Mactra antiquata]